MNEMALSRTRPVLPSLLGSFVVCPAKYLLESEAHSYARLPLHPGVILGQVIHQRVNSVKHREAAPENYTLRQLENDFKAALTANRRAGPVVNWIYDRHGVAGLVSRQMLVTQIRYVRSLQPPVFIKGVPAHEKTLPVGREVMLVSGDFDMHGRADFIYQERPDRLNIVDLKTGKVTDEQNQPKEASLLQVAAYGIMVKEQVPDMDIGLVLTGSRDSWEGTLNADLIERVTMIIKNINRLLPRNIPLSVYELACPGMHCSHCSCRCSCPAWIEKLRRQMQPSHSDHQHGGIDISGQLLDVQSDDHLLTLKILLPNSSVVKVFRVPSSTIPELTEITGKKIALYGLNTFSETSTEYFPRNFYVINMQDTRRSAFQFHWQSEGEN
ncbi:PD-(D/E)XK nuclease family protein [Pantoea sp. V106_11]|uniref:PD-(D/E)XK nuclease family protein n=1 Tax=Pantoea sp. V106_11 TaxID=3044234 RepID=UPI00249EEEC1|nr:PD-(D/E)XK nuclease family protein [Pantoea sp. V106_11]MDI3416660.1 PD-(D/E)XK nuclease family protein [Pantoea sp. V106_11]